MPTYVRLCIYICVYIYAYIYVCKCIHDRGGESWRVEKMASLRAAAVSTCAPAKENCGRKSLLIEHEACHLKLESSETQKPQQADICVVLLFKGPPEALPLVSHY